MRGAAAKRFAEKPCGVEERDLNAGKTVLPPANNAAADLPEFHQGTGPPSTVEGTNSIRRHQTDRRQATFGAFFAEVGVNKALPAKHVCAGCTGSFAAGRIPERQGRARSQCLAALTFAIGMALTKDLNVRQTRRPFVFKPMIW